MDILKHLSLADHPLFKDPSVDAYFSMQKQAGYYLTFERALTTAAGSCGHWDAALTQKAVQRMKSFEPDMQELLAGIQNDGLPVPTYVKALKNHVGEDFASVIHTGSTSQDVMDTALALALKAINTELAEKLADMRVKLTVLLSDYSDAEIMGRTRMQSALPIKAGHRIAAWLQPFDQWVDDFGHRRDRVEVLQLGGPVGDGRGFGDHFEEMQRLMAVELGLNAPTSGSSNHTNRSHLADYASLLSLITGGLGKIGQDVCLMAQQGVDEISLDGGGGSSAMPHKQNPILAEVLVTQARFNAMQLSGMYQALVHEQERSGSAWMLEWLILPQMISTTSAALSNALSLLGSIKTIGKSTA